MNWDLQDLKPVLLPFGRPGEFPSAVAAFACLVNIVLGRPIRVTRRVLALIRYDRPFGRLGWMFPALIYTMTKLPG